MIQLFDQGVYLVDGVPLTRAENLPSPQIARRNTIAHSILQAHNQSGSEDKLRIRFDALVSHDITYVGIIQTARASGLDAFPVPYALTNCHNSLCAVGGTINEDDHIFGLSAAKKYGGIYVPANQSVIHMYAREEMAACGSMILGSDSHTRYGALGTMGIGEGGPEIVKQLLSNTYDVNAPQVVLVYLENAPKPGIGPHDVAISLVGAVFNNGFVKNCVLEFTGPGVKHLSADMRNGIDVMTTETTCLSSIWSTDETIQEYYRIHGRPEAYRKLQPGNIAYYDKMIKIDLSAIECMIALPFHPSNAVSIRTLNENAHDLLHEVEIEAQKSFGSQVQFHLTDKIKDGKIYADQGVIAGCAGGLFDNICDAAAILQGGSIGDDYFNLSVYPGSVPVNIELSRNGVLTQLLEAGAIVKPAFCGPCFGAGDVPGNNGFSIRHTTRNFPNREGSKPAQGQLSCVALMDARSIAATARNGGVITPATDCQHCIGGQTYSYDPSAYQQRVYNGFQAPQPQEPLRFGPNIADWPKMSPMQDHLLLKLTAVIMDPVTTTDELIPSGETSSYRSNPYKLAEFTLSRRVPEYVGRCKQVQTLEEAKRAGSVADELRPILDQLHVTQEDLFEHTNIGSVIFAKRPGDGSAREQAASCQRVLGALANICYEYATKRYRSNCINWGMVPFTLDENEAFDYQVDDYIFVPNIKRAIMEKQTDISAKVVTKGGVSDLLLHLDNLTDDERTILLEGCLINYYAAQKR